jgi:diguanylate cyclase (GGDEF)-like protein
VNPGLLSTWLPLALATACGVMLLRDRKAWGVTAFATTCWAIAGVRYAGIAYLLTPSMLVGAGGLSLLTWGLLQARRIPFAADAGSHDAGQAEQPQQTTNPAAETTQLASIGELTAQFDEWLALHRNQPDPWPDFGEFLRSALVLACGARHIRAYRLLTNEESELCPLRRTEPGEHDFPSVHSGLVGNVVTSGKSFHAADGGRAPLVEALASDDDTGTEGCTWCFAIRQQRGSIGVVRVGEIDPTLAGNRARLEDIEAAVTLFWSVLTESCRARVASFVDPLTGALTHRAFMESAQRVVEDSYTTGEPVAVLTVSLEGLRALADRGHWDAANQIAFEVSLLLRERLRDEDELGVFDGSRFLVLLRRVDSDLATLIARQLLERISPVMVQRSRGGIPLTLRCGVAGSGGGRPSLRDMIVHANASCREARRAGVALMTSLPVKEEVAPPCTST